MKGGRRRRRLKVKAKREAHKKNVQDIDSALKVVMHRYAPRFSLLGTDNDSRVYYAPSPGLADSEHALEFIASKAAESGAKKSRSARAKKRRARDVEERSTFREWSWLVAVWGKKPSDAAPHGGKGNKKAVASADDSDSGEESDDDEDIAKWWVFWQPEEIRKVADWIAIKSGLTDDGSEHSSTGSPSASTGSGSLREGRGELMATSEVPCKDDLRSLVRNLREYATVLEWRIKDDDAEPVEEEQKPVKGKGKGRA